MGNEFIIKANFKFIFQIEQKFNILIDARFKNIVNIYGDYKSKELQKNKKKRKSDLNCNKLLRAIIKIT
jgi:hypothetical protein